MLTSTASRVFICRATARPAWTAATSFALNPMTSRRKVRIRSPGCSAGAETVRRAARESDRIGRLKLRMRSPMISVRPVLICLVILVAEFAVLEGALRVYGGSEAASSFQSILMQDPRIGHRLKPDARTRYTTVEFSTEIVINAQGVRDDQDIGPKAPGERRVLVLGDSLVLSVQVPLEQTFCKQLEARLAAADPAHRWRVINGGVQGYGPVKDWLFYRNVAEAFQPDIVMIVAFVGNDAVEANDDEPSLNAGR